MPNKILIHEPPPGLSIGGHSINLGDLIRYAELIDRVRAVGTAAAHLKPGAEVDLPEVKFDLEGGEYEWDLGTLRRVK